MSQYTEPQQAYIDELLARIEDHHVPMAVVDCLGKVYQDDRGRFQRVTGNTKPENRFECRDLRHVQIYKLKAAALNKAAKAKAA